MIFNIEFIRILLLVCFIHGVASHPKHGVGKDGTGKKASKEIEKRINLKSAVNKYQRRGDDIVENIELSDGNYKGHAKLRDNGPMQSSTDNDYRDISAFIKLNDNGSVGGTLNVPDYDGNDKPDIDNSGQPDRDNGQVNEEDAIIGSIEIGDDDIKGTINFPDENNKDDILEDGNISSGIRNDKITGDMAVDDEGNVEGHVSIDHKDENNNNKDGNISSGIGNDKITGDMTIDDEGNIDGHISIDDENENANSAPVISDDNSNDILSHQDPNKPNNEKRPKYKDTCWMNLNSNQYLDALDEIDAKYSKARRQYQDTIGPDFDKKMMEALLSSQGKAPRAIHQAHGNPNVIPAGLNLGGFGMMRMPGSMLFFHRMKLRNSTVFRVDFLQANLMEMSLVARMSLNNLHLHGSYERATTERDEAVLYFVPSYGELDVLIKSVNYKMEGRLRMLNNRLMIELVNSDILALNVLLSYANSSASTVKLDNIEDFVGRMKCDLDTWLKDYFNDYLMYFGIVGVGKNSEIQLYEKEKTIKASEYADYAIKGIKKKLRQLKAANVKIPSFTLLSVVNHKIELKNGILRGLDSMYRRSVAMTKKGNGIRTLDMIIGFSNLKVEYQYEALVMRGTPPLTGSLILTADEISAHLEVSQVSDAEIVDLNVDSIKQLKSESLTVEGPANRLIANFKFILENPIIAIMTNVMKHNIKMLKTLSRCSPHLWGNGKEFNLYTDDYHDESFKPSENRQATIFNSIEAITVFSDEKDSDSVKPENKQIISSPRTTVLK